MSLVGCACLVFDECTEFGLTQITYDVWVVWLGSVSCVFSPEDSVECVCVSFRAIQAMQSDR